MRFLILIFVLVGLQQTHAADPLTPAISAAAAAQVPAQTLAQIADLQSTPDGQDKRACSSTSDCLPNENCIHGQCVLQGGGGSCLGDTDCAIGEHCVAGVCRR